MKRKYIDEFLIYENNKRIKLNNLKRKYIDDYLIYKKNKRIKLNNLTIIIPDYLPCEICCENVTFYRKCGNFIYCSLDCYTILLLQKGFINITFTEK